MFHLYTKSVMLPHSAPFWIFSQAKNLASFSLGLNVFSLEGNWVLKEQIRFLL